MAAKLRIDIVFAKDAFSHHPSQDLLLYGRNRFDGNGDKIIYVNDVVPLPENKCSQIPYFTYQDSNNSSSNLIIGLVCNNIHNADHERMLEVLKQEAKLKECCVLVISINEICPGKLLLLINSGFSLERTPPFEHSNIKETPNTEVRIVCLKQNLSVSKLSCWYLMDTDKSTLDSLKGRKFSKRYINGIQGQQVNSTTDKHSILTGGNDTNNRSNSVPAAFELLFLSVSWLLSLVQQRLIFATVLFGYLPKYLFVAKQLSHRMNQLHDMFINKQERQEQVNIGSKLVTNGNLIISLVVDIVLGFLVIYFVFLNQHSLSMSSWLIGQKYNIAEHLSNLLKWLMGSPAGLKLNIPLNQFLGNFYSYHVHLWTSYLFFIEAYLPTIILGCTLAGCLGVTFLIALLCDLLSLLTVHIYCFYIYAARLFGLEIHVLASLLRLFTGKKWNSLRNRVDSVEYDVDRLFIGTLLFTISLFLFPTIFLYYIVFTILRILVLLVQSFLYGMVALVNTFPFFGLWLYIVHPERLPGQIIIDTMNISCGPRTEDVFYADNVNSTQPDSCQYLSFRHKCLPCGDLFKNCMSGVIQTAYRDIFGEGILYKLLTGKIITKP
ncbi:N-acetylglucosaminyl-phosphatidylinositol biosynthetic protein gpi1-like [Dendronephthya gigantea]|uniref:N-acetylglucosaminyl-phosphatidylinositol biosynthetic protein gpi1-like n=1 Tax=Dendronephthya gigantea TaxID=151771 RepID=UPI001069B5A9|nr:N-acetylglucosaminyl-phosphatidylinositol biosynthetic protein gpi1-like [Dendronephthya gigantea]